MRSAVCRTGRPRRGFTLIELLVVIAIIAILAAILFPVFARARENARRASCQSNMKQIGLGYMQYLQDYDERVPCGLWQYSVGGSWAGEIYPYIKSSQVFACPSDSDQSIGGSTYYHGNISYVMNMAPYFSPGAGASPFYPTIAKFNATSKTVLFFEATTNTSATTPVNVTLADEGGNTNAVPHSVASVGCTQNGNVGDEGLTWGGSIIAATGVMGNRNGGTTTPNGCLYNNGVGHLSPITRHFDGSNFLAVDGHVKFLRGQQVSNGISAALPTDAQDASNAGNNQHPGNTVAAGTQAAGWAMTFSYN